MKKYKRLCFLLAPLMVLSACTPTLHLATDKPIEINMNITIEIKIAIERELDELLTDESGLF